FFQAEDGIRDFHVTGVQTCALPIYQGGIEIPNRCHVREVYSAVNRTKVELKYRQTRSGWTKKNTVNRTKVELKLIYDVPTFRLRSEERRVGKGGRSWLHVSVHINMT